MIRAWLVVVVVGLVVLPGLQHRIEAELLPLLDAELVRLEHWRPPTVVRVLDRRGDELDRFAVVRREWVDLDTLPDVAWQAIVAAEDRRFFDHAGVDIFGILRAAWVNLAAREVREGGSTLTQQLVKNVVLDNQKSFERKATEALLAWRLEQRLTKLEILELYLNYVYLGSGNYGIEAASWDYFGAPASALDAGQAALLAGLVPAPSSYSPRRYPEVAAERRRIVLRSMRRAGTIDEATEAAANEVRIDPPRRELGDGSVGTAYRTGVRREVRRLFGDEAPFDAGLTVHTPYDGRVQEAAERALRDTAEAVERRQGHGGPLRRIGSGELDLVIERATGLARDEQGQVLTPEPGDCFEAVSLTPKELAAGPHRFRWNDASWNTRLRSRTDEQLPLPLSRVARRGDVWRVCLEAGDRVALGEGHWVEGAVVVLDGRTGGVVATVGGRDMPLEGFHRATQALRQAGSSFKPFVYAAALERGGSTTDMVLDAPLALPAGGGRIWSPKNYGGGYAGSLPMRTAFARSLNTVAVRLAMQVGADRVAAVAKAAGVRSPLRADLTIALGSSEVTPMDLAIGISTFLRHGRAVGPVWIERVVDGRGQTLGRAGQAVSVADAVVQLPGAFTQAIDPAAAWQTVELMRAVVEEGTGRSARVVGRDRGGKTGTSSGFADAWFVGFTGRHVIAVWVGDDARGSLGHGETGGRTALPVYRAIAEILDEPEDARWTPPPEVLLVPWQGRWVGVDALQWGEGRLWAAPGPAPLPDYAEPAR